MPVSQDDVLDRLINPCAYPNIQYLQRKTSTMPTFMHEFPNGETHEAKIHPNGCGIVCLNSQVDAGTYISKGTTVLRSMLSGSIISKSNISESNINSSQIISSTLFKGELWNSTCNNLNAEESVLKDSQVSGMVRNSNLKHTFLTGGDMDHTTADHCRLQGRFERSKLVASVIIGTVLDSEINNSEITRADLHHIKGHIQDTGRSQRVQYFIVDKKMYIAYRTHGNHTVELTLTSRDFRTSVKSYFERINVLSFDEDARKTEIDWLCAVYRSYRTEEVAA